MEYEKTSNATCLIAALTAATATLIYVRKAAFQSGWETTSATLPATTLTVSTTKATAPPLPLLLPLTMALRPLEELPIKPTPSVFDLQLLC